MYSNSRNIVDLTSTNIRHVSRCLPTTSPNGNDIKHSSSKKTRRADYDEPFFVDLDDDFVDLSIDKFERGQPARERNEILPEQSLQDTLSELIYKDKRLSPSKCVELSKGAVLSDKTVLEKGYFLRIKTIIKRQTTLPNGTKQPVEFLRGSLFKRHRDLWGILPLTAGEVALVRDVVEVDVQYIVRIRKLRITNLPAKQGRISQLDAKDENVGLLICRWKLNILDNPAGESASTILGDSGYIRRITEAEADCVDGYKIKDVDLTTGWREGIITNADLPSVIQRKRSYDDFEVKSYKRRTPRSSPLSEYRPEMSDIHSLQHSSYEECSSSQGNVGSFSQASITTSRISPQSKSHSLQRSFSTSSISNTREGDQIRSLFNMATFSYSQISLPRQIPRSVSSVNLTKCKSSCSKYVDLTKDVPCKRAIVAKDVDPDVVYAGSFNKNPNGYTFSDAFCGAGGVSAGARMAGLKVLWGFDKDDKAIDAYQKNFGRHRGYYGTAHDFVVDEPYPSPDVLHLSPPCQTYSWAKTTVGRDDEANESSTFAIGEVLAKVRPRAASLEQTDGIVYIRGHFKHFFQVLHQFTSKGYSIKWKVLHAMDYGVPSKRKRLIMIASCPGETLANMPIPTHYNPYIASPSPPTADKKLRKVPTLGQVINNIPFNAEDQEHNYFSTPRYSDHDLNKPLGRTIMASGGDYDVHPNGLRKFTVRELACISTFPVSHRFSGAMTARKHQIGNAVPPKLAEAFLTAIMKHLAEIDEGHII